jgi:2-oxoglutarate ferredoxin oxidoreductase subunit gamma
MYSEIIMAGFGGQGVLLIGKLLAYAGLEAGREVTWMPAYGPEMRGGTCNCTVVLSDRQVGSPISARPHLLIALNLPSLDKFEAMVRPGGVIPTRKDVVVVPVAANELALEAGTAKAANMVALGALLGATGLADIKQVQAIIEKTFAAKPKMVTANNAALSRGFEIGRPFAGKAAA